MHAAELSPSSRAAQFRDGRSTRIEIVVLLALGLSIGCGDRRTTRVYDVRHLHAECGGKSILVLPLRYRPPDSPPLSWTESVAQELRERIPTLARTDVRIVGETLVVYATEQDHAAVRSILAAG